MEGSVSADRAEARPDDTYTAMAKSEGALQVWSDRMRLTLMPLVEAAAFRGAVEEAWDKHQAGRVWQRMRHGHRDRPKMDRFSAGDRDCLIAR